MPSRIGRGSHWCESCGHAKCGHRNFGFIRKIDMEEGSHELICRKNTPRGCHNTTWDNENAYGYMTEWEECRCTREFKEDEKCCI